MSDSSGLGTIFKVFALPSPLLIAAGLLGGYHSCSALSESMNADKIEHGDCLGEAYALTEKDVKPYTRQFAELMPFVNPAPAGTYSNELAQAKKEASAECDEDLKSGSLSTKFYLFASFGFVLMGGLGLVTGAIKSKMGGFDMGNGGV